MLDQPEHDWQNCQTCLNNVEQYGVSYFDPATGWHPRPSLIFQNEEGWHYTLGTETWSSMVGPSPELGHLDNLHQLKDGKVELCLSLS
jgi:hypothetical protein